MNFAEIKESIITTFRAPNGPRFIPLIEGQPGGGKSALARTVGEEMGFGDNIHQMFLSLRDPVDLMGTPRNDGDVTRWVPPSELYKLREGRHLLILEELSDAPTGVQNAACGLIYDRAVNELHLSPETYIIATANRTKDKSGANRIVSKLYNRVCRFEYVENIDVWSEWALDAGIDVTLIQFLRFRPDLLADFDPNRPCNPTPRAWERVNSVPDMPSNIYFGTIAGLVGEGPAAEFTGFKRIFSQMPSIEGILLNPTRSDVPTDPATLYALTGALAHRTTKDNFDRVYEYIDRLAPEFQVMCVQDAMRLQPKIKETKAFGTWAVRNSNVLL